MSGSAFRQGAQIQLEGKRYILLRKLDANLWQTEETRTKRIEEFTHQQLLSPLCRRKAHVLDRRGHIPTFCQEDELGGVSPRAVGGGQNAARVRDGSD